MAKRKSAEPDTLVALSIQDRMTVARVEVDEITERANAQVFRDEVEPLIEDSDIGVIVDFGSLTGAVDSPLLGVLVGIAKEARRSRKEFAICGLTGSMAEAYEIARMSSQVPAYEDLGSALMSLGDGGLMTTNPAQTVEDLEARMRARRPSRTKKKSSEPEPVRETQPAVEFDGESWLEENGKNLGIAGSIFAAAILLVVVSQFGGSILASLPSSAPEAELTLRGRVQYMSRGRAADDGGAVVLAWPSGGAPDRKLTLDDLDDLSQRGDSEATDFYATTTEKDGSYELNIKSSEEVLNVLVISNNLQEKRNDASSLSSLDSVFVDPLEVVGKKGHELGFVSVGSSSTQKHDVTVSPRYVAN